MHSSLVRSLFPVSLLLLSARFGSERAPAPEGQLVVSGRVVDASTSQPIDQAVVAVRDTPLGAPTRALYEIVPPGSRDAKDVRGVDELRYTREAGRTTAARSSELMHVRLRYKPATEKVSRELTHVVRDEVAGQLSEDFVFAAAVAEFGLVLRDSPHKGRASMDSVTVRAERSKEPDAFGYRGEFVRLATLANELVRGERVAVRKD